MDTVYPVFQKSQLSFSGKQACRQKEKSCRIIRQPEIHDLTAQIPQEFPLFLSAVFRVLAGLKLAESNGNGLIPAFLLVIHQNGK